MNQSTTYSTKIIISILIGAISLLGDVYGQSFPCSEDIYIAMYNDVEERSDILILDLKNNYNYKVLVLCESRKITALGYSVADEYLYALDFHTYELLRIDNEGCITSLGVPRDLDLSLDYYAGTVSALGTGLRVIGRNDEGDADKYFSINLFTDDHYAGYSSVIANQAVSATDIAVDPYRGIMYGYDNQRYEAFVISAGASVTSNNFSPGELSMSALFFDQEGNLYGYRANGDLYSIKKTNGELDKIAELPPSNFADAASCSATYIFTKEVVSDIIVPCDTFQLKYTFTNRMGIGQAGLFLKDTFPMGYEVIDFDLNYYYGDVDIMETSNVLSLDDFDFVLDDNEVVVSVVAPPIGVADDSWESSGFLAHLPQAVGAIAKTDDPSTQAEGDATAVNITSLEDIRLEDFVEDGCSVSEVIIRSPLPNADNQWHDGSTGDKYTAEEIGWVALTAIDDCNIYFDSVFIGELGSANYVDIIGLQESYSVGDQLVLSVDTDLLMPYDVVWKIDGTVVSDLPSYMFEVKGNHLIVLNLTKDDCEVSDVATVGMDGITNTYVPNVFSPNGDGINDKFTISTSGNGTYNLMVFDRWGSLLYNGSGLELNDEQSSWDGSYNGRKVVNSILIWKVEINYSDGTQESKIGEVVVYD